MEDPAGGNAMSILLPDRWAEFVREAPRGRHGLLHRHREDSLGELFEHVVIDSGWVVDVPGYAGIPFTGEPITDIQVTNDQSKYKPRRS